MSGIRPGDIPDMDAICELGSELLEDSLYGGIKPDETKFRLFVAGLMGHNKGSVLLVVDDDDKPQGFLLGMVDTLFFSQKCYATDMAVYVREEYRHLAPGLFKRFIAWAESKPKVAQIILGQSSGIGDPDRVGRMYEHLGLSHVGGIYMKRV